VPGTTHNEEGKRKPEKILNKEKELELNEFGRSMIFLRNNLLIEWKNDI
jgi:hypothetical protein